MILPGIQITLAGCRRAVVPTGSGEGEKLGELTVGRKDKVTELVNGSLPGKSYRNVKQYSGSGGIRLAEVMDVYKDLGELLHPATKIV